MDQRAYQHVVRFLGVENVVRLEAEAEAAIADEDFVCGRSNARKSRKQASRPA